MSLLDLDTDDDAKSRKALLDSRPMISPESYQKPTDGETTTVFVKVEGGKGFLARFRPAIMEKRYELDVFGTFVLRQINGSRTVLELVDLFKKRFKLSRRECELGVVAFLKLLNHRRVINVIATDQ